MHTMTWEDSDSMEGVAEEIVDRMQVGGDDDEVMDMDDDKLMTMTDPSTSRESDTSGDDDDGNLPELVARLLVEDEEGGLQDALPKSSHHSSSKDDASEFSFSSIECEEEEENSLEGFVDLAKPFDMELLRSSIENGGAVLDKVEDQDVVLVVGKTGVGKSLFIQGIAGKKIVQIEHETSYSGESVYSSVFEAEDALPGFEVGHKKVSKTRAINYFVRQGVGKSGRDVVYLDSPGFEDTAGPEVDIATSVMLNQVAKTARSLRFVILVNYASLLEDRGGAVRAVLKLARTFVSDFEMDKKSFMFLFTHTHQTDMPESLDAARSRLGKEIFRIMEGTDDPDVKSVLKFMHKSISKRYLFVDVLHPLKSDFKEISNFIEARLSTIKNPAQVMNCGLTSHAQMRLIGQLRQMNFTLMGLLHEKNCTDEEDMQELKHIRSAFQYFNRYIAITDVRTAHEECEAMFEKHLQTQRLIFDKQLQKAVENAHFDSGNVRVLKAAVAQLAAFSGSNATDYFDRCISEAFSISHDRVMDSQPSELEETLSDLGKLRAWSGGFDRFSRAYKEVCVAVETKINAITAGVFQIDIIPDDISSEKLVHHSKQLVDLEQVVLVERRLAVHEIDTSPCSAALESLRIMMSSRASMWATATVTQSNQEGDPWDRPLSSVRLAVERARKLWNAQAILINAQACHGVVQAIARAVGEIESFVSQGFQWSCDELSCHLKDFPRGTEEKWASLADVATCIGGMPGPGWKEVARPYRILLDSLKCELNTRFGALEASARQCKGEMMKEGKKEAEKYLAFRALSWCDSLLDCGLVQQGCDSVLMFYRARMELVLNEARVHSEKLELGSDHNIESLKACHQAFVEIKHFEEFEAVVGAREVVIKKRLEAFKGLKRYRQDLVEKTSQWTSHWHTSWKKKEMDDARSLTETLDKVLAEIAVIESFKYMNGLKTDAAGAKARVLAALTTAVDYANGEFSKPGDYQGKADCLARIASLSGFFHSDAYLPEIAFYRSKAHSLVSKDALEIEKLVEESTDGTKIDEHLEAFKKARVLDPYTNNEASDRLRPLEALRDKRADDTDKLLEDMIERRNFKGMGRFLTQLKDSNNAIQKQKFQQYKRTLASDLKDLAMGAHAKLNLMVSREDVVDVVNTLATLQDAKEDIGSLLVWSEINLVSEINALQDKLSRKLKNWTDSLLAGYNSSDYYAMGKNHHLALIVFELAEQFLNPSVKHDFQSADAKMKGAIQKVPAEVDKFVQSAFQEYRYLNQILPSLKMASSSEDPAMPELKRLYEATMESLSQKTNSLLQNYRDEVTRTESYDDGIDILEALDRALSLGMGDYLKAMTLPFHTSSLLAKWKSEQEKLERMETLVTVDEKMRKIKQRLDKLKNSGWFDRVRYRTHLTYERLQGRLDLEGQHELTLGLSSLRERDWDSLQSSLDVLVHMTKELSEHLPATVVRGRQLSGEIVVVFTELCKEAVECLESVNCLEAQSLVKFEAIFPDMRRCALDFTFVLDNVDAKKEFVLVNQLVHDIMKRGISELSAALSDNDFSKARALVQHNRTSGAFLADHYSLLKEELRQRDILQDEKWLALISNICAESFSGGRDLANIKSCAILGVLPSASEAEVRKAYKQKAKHVHPDKKVPEDGKDGADVGEDFRKVKEAQDVLLNPRSREKVSAGKPFDSTIQGVPGNLQKITREYLRDQKYDHLEHLLERILDLQLVCNLVTPPLDYEAIRNCVLGLVRDWVQGLRVAVDSQWKERKYRELNLTISDLKQMENHLKSFPDAFPGSWNSGIVEKVQEEIESLGVKARSFLKNKTTAVACVDDFRRCFIQMGFVLVELQHFKCFTKSVMCTVLESCLKSDWGYSFLFELGLSFHRGDDSSEEDEKLIAQTLLGEFTHFKEVMTMVWNEETFTKPVEDTVADIVGEKWNAQGDPPSHVDIDRDALLRSFHSFETSYNKLLGDYLAIESDKGELALKTIAFATQLKPLSCASEWDPSVKSKIPQLLAGVFALFTILKSGESYNRIQDSAEAQNFGEKLLMKPHNIQVLTLLHLLGCGKASSDTSLESHLMQIRTGEGKSMILGAAAAILGLLGFKVRCVCYSEYLSNRDYKLFEDVFKLLRLEGLIRYSKITRLSEDTTARKGDIRVLTESLLRGGLQQRPTNSHRALEDTTRGNSGSATEGSSSHENMVGTIARTESSQVSSLVTQASCNAPVPSAESEEILLIDEVDVFFGPNFYGNTYNKVMELRDPEIAEILSNVWGQYRQGGRKQRLADIQTSPPYARLVQKLPSFKFLIDNEIRLMLDHVGRVDEEKYYLDPEHDRIGYRVLDTISYQATYGYRTVFAYLKEADDGNLKDKNATLKRVLSMPIQCGQFSYANISPSRILGVSGTLRAMGEYEKDVLKAYGVQKFVFVPSVYGSSNFVFDKAGDGIFVEQTKSDYFQKITEEIQSKTQQKRAVIVFFQDIARLDEYKSSPFFPRLGRQKAILAENMDPGEKEFIINKAATSGQITLCPAVFGRGTDFFCKDDKVQAAGGVHVIQTFLSTEESEEVQIQGRTSRQGKKGSYQLVLWEDDLVLDFDLARGEMDRVSRSERYDWLCKAREKRHEKHWANVEENLEIAQQRDTATHEYFDALLSGNEGEAFKLFQGLYSTINKPPIPESISVDLALILDVTGSMSAYYKSTLSTIRCILTGNESILSKLKSQFPQTEIKLRLAVMGYRDIDDGSAQFEEIVWGGSHFTESTSDALARVTRVTKRSSGGHDLAEDHFGAITRCLSWNGPSDWSSPIKMALLFTDAPAHGCVPPASSRLPNVDGYSVRHPEGLTPQLVAGDLLSKGVNLVLCSYNPIATAITEDLLAEAYSNHPLNSDGRQINAISMVPRSAVQSSNGQALIGEHSRHIIFVLDESGSMENDWEGVVRAFHAYLDKRLQNQNETDLVSVVQFDDCARTTVLREPIGDVSDMELDFSGGMTNFAPAALEGSQLAASTPRSHRPTIVFMSDGCAEDADEAASTFSALNKQVKQKHGCDLDLHVIAFRGGADTRQLQQISRASPQGRVHLSSDTVQLVDIFASIAGGQQVATALQEEIGKEISEAVSDTLSLGYLS